MKARDKVKVAVAGALVVAMVLVWALALAAEPEGKESALSAWLKDLQRKIKQIMPRKSPPMETAVAGIRGAEVEQKVVLYWKGKEGEEPVSEAELAKFEHAIDLAARGERTAAIKELEEFMAQFPDSALIPDAQKTLSLL